LIPVPELEKAMNPTPETSRRRWFAGLAALGCVGLLSKHAHAQGWGRGEPLDPEEMARRLNWRIGRLINDVGGTPQQKDQLVAIATAALADLKPLREQARAARRQGLDLLAAPTVDRAALEQLRATQMQLADTSSRRVLQAMADASDVLTPDQRTKVADRLKQRMDRRWRG
jgi:Spy/CpxP family protein refolding chaperone